MSEQASQFRRHALSALRSYWGSGQHHIREQFLAAQSEFNPPCTEPDFILISLPDWAEDLAADGGILVPAGCVRDGAEPPWERTDWLLAAFHLLECTAERAFEREHGSIHSYSFRLHGWDPRVWQRAWVNRIALFLRRWEASRHARSETEIFGPVPQARIFLTHDVDAIRKTLPIRLKQGAFNVWKALSSLANAKAYAALQHFGTALRFLFSNAEYDHLESIAHLVRERSLDSSFNFFGAKESVNWLFDPGYDIGQPIIQSKLRRLVALGFNIGLHQSFGAFEDAARMRAERNRLEHHADTNVNSCRQHWLRFSWEKTWKAQSDAGLQIDCTLGFNDRPGFRAASALRWHPWSQAMQRETSIEAMPLLFMDSHFYDYNALEPTERKKQMSHWLEEVQAVGGTASVLWHPHSLSTDYGWKEGFVELLDRLERMK